ncbi:hypothetical protein DL767_002118 [Monosporascus sp. MG133]|nr:hypothetical protein DL767_002118 [Monosporascus sp. MG133]
MGTAVQVGLFGVVGNDSAGQQVYDLLSAYKNIALGIHSITGRHTPHKRRVIAQANHYLFRIDTETTDYLPGPTETALIAGLQEHLATNLVQGIICSDYAKGTLSPTLLQAVILAGRERRIPVLIDGKGSDPTRYAGATVLKVNLAELGDLAWAPVATPVAAAAAARSVLAKTDVAALVVTLGEGGAHVYDSRDSLCEQLEAYKHPAGTTAPDTNGAGDTFLAAFALAFCSGASAAWAARLGCIAAGVAVTKPRTAAVERGELLRAAAGQGGGQVRVPSRAGAGALRRSAGKVVGLEVLCRELLTDLRSSGASIVFTNGCFDLLHAGHVRILEDSKALGDVLVVGLNSDESVRELKGSGRPVMGEEQRALCLAALGCVDFVVVFSDPTPLALIENIRPDVLVKGADYAKSQVVGADVVESYGGRVELLPLYEGISTTKILESMVKRLR